MAPVQNHASEAAPPPFRLDVELHELLMNPASKPTAPPPPRGEPLSLPEPVFPSRPKLQQGPDSAYIPHNGNGRHWAPSEILHTMKGWMFPYFKSRLLPGDFHPIIGYLFTEWKCNLDCYYCWAFENSVKGMTEDVARRSIDWLESTTCRVLALMGGEPLLRPDFVHKVVYYAAKKGFWIYLPTNGRLMRPKVIDQLGDAGVSVVNLAIDAMDLKP
ncbi:MAG TPA: radical SAM protein, partial [Terriglobales bacterium]|nr:radical SAM protein [Terriglobales bacterium]